MAFISAFQAEDGGSIPPTRSRISSTKDSFHRAVFCLLLANNSILLLLTLLTIGKVNGNGTV